jgi:hypothetical protein
MVFLFYVFGNFPAVLFVLKYAFVFVFLNSVLIVFVSFSFYVNVGKFFLYCCFHVADVSVSIIVENRLDIVCVL